jgi:hypothetical protein
LRPGRADGEQQRDDGGGVRSRLHHLTFVGTSRVVRESRTAAGADGCCGREAALTWTGGPDGTGAAGDIARCSATTVPAMGGAGRSGVSGYGAATEGGAEGQRDRGDRQDQQGGCRQGQLGSSAGRDGEGRRPRDGGRPSGEPGRRPW